MALNRIENRSDINPAGDSCVVGRARHTRLILSSQQRFLRSRGMTLLELLVTLSVSAILITVAAPSFQDMVRRTRVASETNEVLVALTLARSEALKRGARVSVCASADPEAATPSCSDSTDWSSGWIVFVDTATDESLMAIDEVLRVWPGLQGSSLAGDAASARFDSIGGSLQSLELKLTPDGCTKTEARKITVNPVGRATIVECACSG